MKRTHITLQDLIDNDACEDQRELFAATFGESVKIGLRNGFKALKAGLDVLWCERFIPAAALAEYVEVRDAALAEYDKATAPAWAEYSKVRAAAWAEYDKATAAAWDEYDKATAAAWDECMKSMLPNLVHALTAEASA